MSNFVDPSDQALWPKLNVSSKQPPRQQQLKNSINGDDSSASLSYERYKEQKLNKSKNDYSNNRYGYIDDSTLFASRYSNARRAHKKNGVNKNAKGYVKDGSEHSVEPYNVESDTISHEDSHLNDYAYVDNDRRLQKMRLYQEHESDRRNRHNEHHLYASTMHSNVTNTGKNTVWNTAAKKHHENLSYYERIRKEVERNTISSYNEESQIISNWHHVLKANTMTIAKNARLRDEVVPKIKRIKPNIDKTTKLCVSGKRENKIHSEFHLRNKDQGYDVIANGGAPHTQGAKALHKVRLLDAAKSHDYRYWNTHSHHTHLGKNNVWNVQKPKFEDTRRTSRGRNPAPPRIKQQFDILARSKTIFED